jgi:hypothetical protein
MSHQLAGLLAFIAMSIVCATVCHALMHRYALAVAISAFATSGLFLVLVTHIDGRTDPLILGAFIFCMLYGSVIGLIVGVPFAVYRRRHAIPPGCCKICGYFLTGNTSGVCPECGTTIWQPDAVAR